MKKNFQDVASRNRNKLPRGTKLNNDGTVKDQGRYAIGVGQNWAVIFFPNRSVKLKNKINRLRYS